MLHWCLSRGSGGNQIQLTFTVPEGLDETIRSTLSELYGDGSELATNLAQREVKVVTQGDDGKPRLDYKLGS